MWYSQHIPANDPRSNVDGRRGERHTADAQVHRSQVYGHLGGQSQRPVIGAGRQRHYSGQVQRLHGQVQLRMQQTRPRHLVAATQQTQHHWYNDNRLQDAQPLRYLHAEKNLPLISQLKTFSER